MYLWLLKNKGQWSITEEGCEAYKRYPDPAALHRRAAQLYREWHSDQPSGEDDSLPEPENVSDAVENTINGRPNAPREFRAR
jgi:hypothetical protein